MFLPRFSVRWLLLLTAVAALVFFVVAQATQGALWAMAVSAAIGVVCTMFVLYIQLFVIAWLFAKLFGLLRPARLTSPFATDALPPQIITPQDPD